MKYFANIVRRNRTGNKVWAGGRHPHVNILAEETVGPAVEGTVTHRGEVVRHKVVAQLITLRTSAIPSASVSRSKVMRLALGVAAPARLNALTRTPAAAVGWVPEGQPMAGAMLTVGIRLF